MAASIRISEEQSSTGLKVAIRIINAWRATPRQACKILRISPSTYRRISRGMNAGSRLDLDQQQRIGIVLSIHASMRTVFTNQANVQGFPGLKNNNSFFEGQSPLEVMAQGSFISLYETYKRIKQLQFGHT
ncbi:hypothetical protein ALP90_02036 [Pseudomonas amygdali pv. ulmi]|uniref:Antitoxin Xre-like helix-turn-helix domain-containing protein n=1 Tax=Pseudomonas amygdali pv. ulmi TaxID=251720 RepID=A0A3M4T6V6_PSEA0|nr:antitoxin Xre-like helix-turn-helix domain-containing protein [Pseudomonas amygdali]RMR22899.1 hypothetical protein ALP90_02036 [Pseudomonas amygdali pv. ulmi]